MTLPDCLRAGPVGRRMLPFEVVQAQRRGRVLAAVTDIFATRGYRTTTIDDLAVASHIGVGSFYTLFEGKEDCFLLAYDRVIDAASERIAAALPAADVSWLERTRAALEALLGWIAAEPLAARIVLIEAQAAGLASLARYQATVERLSSLLRAGRAHSSAGGELPASFEYATVAGLAWLLRERLVDGEKNGVKVLLPDLVEFVLTPYIEFEEATRVARFDLVTANGPALVHQP